MNAIPLLKLWIGKKSEKNGNNDGARSIKFDRNRNVFEILKSTDAPKKTLETI